MEHPASRAAVASLSLFLLAGAPAFAINEMWAKDAPVTRMTQEDFDIAGAVVRKALDEGREGSSYQWKNDATAASGGVTVLASFEKGGMHCRGAAFTITAQGKSSRSEWNLCKTPDGWKVLEGR
jgi:surface antigen